MRIGRAAIGATLVAALGACSDRATVVQQPDERTRAVAPTVAPDLPVIARAAELAAHDGARVRLVGTYRKLLVARKQGEAPSLFLGTVVIAIDGRAVDYDPSKWDGAPAEIELGTEPRPADEVAQFADQRVVVEGRLVLRPAPADPEAAQEDPAPTLLEPGAVQLAPP